jgi:hypothetical protein
MNVVYSLLRWSFAMRRYSASGKSDGFVGSSYRDLLNPDMAAKQKLDEVRIREGWVVVLRNCESSLWKGVLGRRASELNPTSASSR